MAGSQPSPFYVLGLSIGQEKRALSMGTVINATREAARRSLPRQGRFAQTLGKWMVGAQGRFNKPLNKLISQAGTPIAPHMDAITNAFKGVTGKAPPQVLTGAGTNTYIPNRSSLQQIMRANPTDVPEFSASALSEINKPGGPLLALDSADPSVLFHEFGHPADVALNPLTAPTGGSLTWIQKLVAEAKANRYGRQMKRVANKSNPGMFGANVLDDAMVDTQMGAYKMEPLLNRMSRVGPTTGSATMLGLPNQFRPLVNMANKHPERFRRGHINALKNMEARALAKLPPKTPAQLAHEAEINRQWDAMMAGAK